MSTDADDKQLSQALNRLVEGDFREKWEATKQLTQLGPSAIAVLVPLLQDPDYDWEVRWFAARTLGQFDHPLALQALVNLLHETQETELIAIAAEGLSHFGEQGVDALVLLLDNPVHRLTGVKALASMQHPSVFVPLLAAAEDADPAVRSTALVALANFRNPQVDKLLLAAVNDVNTTVRQEAITHLGLRSHLLAQVNLVDILLPGLWDLSPAVNKASAIALGRLGTATAVASLSRVLSSPHTPEDLQLSIIRALGWIEKESALLALLSAFNMVSATLQAEIVETLTRFQTEKLRQLAGEALCGWLKADLPTSVENSRLQAAIALALGTLQYEPAIPLLMSLQKQSDPQTQLYAEAALRHFAE